MCYFNEAWMSLKHPKISDGYMLSSHGRIKNSIDDNIKPYEASYHSSNGYDYEKFVLKEEYRNISTVQLFPIDDLLCMTFIPVPDELKGKRVKVNHIDGCNRNNHIDNLEWVEDVEEWFPINLDNVNPNNYQVSNWGRIYRKHINKSNFGNQNAHGYNVVYLAYQDQSIREGIKIPIHRLVADRFIPGHSDKKDIVNHIDGVKNNNYWKNLEWTSYQENTQHAEYCELMSHQTGEKASRSKISDTTREEIAKALILSDSRPKKALELLHKNGFNDVTIHMVSHIKRDKNYQKYYQFKHNMKEPMTDEEVSIITKLLIKFNGNMKRTHSELINKGLSNIPYHSINTIKQKIGKKYKFPDSRLNIKISESDRNIIKSIIEECNMSPSKAYKVIQNKPELSHVSIYDIKHIKLKMIQKSESNK